jgi:hypothetical protein
MPRPAVALLGIALAAIAIGVNTVRYPMVWDRIGPAVAGAPAPSEEPPPLAVASERNEAVIPPPAPIAREKSPQVNPPHPEVIQTAVNDRHAEKPASAANFEKRELLVPVTFPPASNASETHPAQGEILERLPPIDAVFPNPNSRDAAQVSNGSIPIYPSTGMN